MKLIRIAVMTVAAAALAVALQTSAVAQTNELATTSSPTLAKTAGDLVTVFEDLGVHVTTAGMTQLLMLIFLGARLLLKYTPAGSSTGAINKLLGHLAVALPAKATALLLALLLPALLFTGCSFYQGPQVLSNESGTGLKAKLPIGYNGNNIAEVDVTLGLFKSTQVIQPVYTNKVYVPAIVIVGTDNGALGDSLGGTNGGNAVMNGGDSYIVNTGDGAVSVTNLMNITTKTWQNTSTNR